MSRRKTERLLSLVVCLLSAGRYLTALQIREAVPGYPESFDAFKRMFERDKDELRELGIPLQTGPAAGEAAILGLAARVWHRAALDRAAAGALLKLRAAGIDPDPGTEPGIEPRLQTGEAAFAPLWQAVRDGRPVSFAYRAAGRSAPDVRHLEPWGVVNRHGRWYVAGHDSDRKAVRVFRLSRIEGPVTFLGPAGAVTVPEGTDVREIVREWDAM